MRLAQVGLLCQAKHWYFPLSLVLKLNFSTFYPPPSPSATTLQVMPAHEICYFYIDLSYNCIIN
jgi:hypothetical protein